MKRIGLLAAAVLALTPVAALAQAPQQPAGTAEQREAMQRLAWMDGEWVGTANIYAGPGRSLSHAHTERIGPMLGGSLRVIEGRATGEDGSVAFNAFAVVSWSDAADRYTMRSYNNGNVGDFPLEVTADGFRWSVPSGGGEMRFVTTFKDGEWSEIGTFVMSGREPIQVIELRLRRRGDTGWPDADPVKP